MLVGGYLYLLSNTTSNQAITDLQISRYWAVIELPIDSVSQRYLVDNCL